MRFSPALLLLCPALAMAQAGPPSTGASVIQMLFSLFVVLALLIGGLWMLKRLSGHQSPSNNLIRVVGGTSLGTRERVVLVELGPTWLVLGVPPHSSNTLAEMPRQALPPSASPTVPGWLQKMLDKKHGKAP